MTHENFWKLLGTVRKLKEKENKCFVCGSKRNIVPHHIKRVKQESEEYYSENNLLFLCDDCHHRYHNQYPKVNSKTFCEFMRKNLKNKVNKKKTYKTDFKINSELNMSKLKRIFKSIDKTHKKVVKVSYNGKIYDISKIWDDGVETMLEASTPKMEDLK